MRRRDRKITFKKARSRFFLYIPRLNSVLFLIPWKITIKLFWVELIEKKCNEKLTIITVGNAIKDIISSYENVNLNTIKYLQNNYSDYIIGYSDHTIGIATPIAAVAMGSKIIEKHITLDRLMKGTDQAGSLAVEGIERMVRDIRNLELSMGVEDIFIADSVQTARVKLERSVASLKNLKKGHVISETDLHLLSPGDGFKWDQRDQLIGQVLSQDVQANEIIYSDFLK